LKEFHAAVLRVAAVPDSIHCPSVQQGTYDYNAALSTPSHAQSTVNQDHTAPASSLPLHLQHQQLTAEYIPVLDMSTGYWHWRNDIKKGATLLHWGER